MPRKAPPPDRDEASARFHVVLVEPQFAGNVGHVARACLNFGVTDLHLVRPCPLTEEGRDRAVHAQKLLDDAVVWDDFDACADHFDYLAAFSGNVSARDRSHYRVPVQLPDVAPRLKAMEGDVALVFGREDDGLSNHQIARSDAVVFLPTSPLYESLNLSHAVSVALYALRNERFGADKRYKPASVEEKELLFQHFERLLHAIELPDHRRDLTLASFRRLVGRAGLSRWEFHRLMGVPTEALKRLDGRPSLKARRRADGGARAASPPEDGERVPDETPRE